jgi:ubiquitin-like-conjugating enzyme ATG3
LILFYFQVLEALVEDGKVPSVEQYLFIFLKFLQSVIPTIEYDYTIGVQFKGEEK